MCVCVCVYVCVCVSHGRVIPEEVVVICNQEYSAYALLTLDISNQDFGDPKQQALGELFFVLLM